MARKRVRRTQTSGKKKSTRSIREKARQAAAKRERGGGGLDTLQNLPQDTEFFSPKMGRGTKGMNRFSIVPYVVSISNHPFQEKGELWPECSYWQHKIGTGTDKKRFICLAKTEQSKKKKCPICEYREALINSGSDPDLAEELRPRLRQLFNILDHDDEDKGIQLFEMSPYMFGFMLDDEDNAQAHKFDDKYYGDISDGLMIEARFNEESFNGSKFAKCARIDFEERPDLSKDITDEAIDLDAALRLLDYNELKKKFHEIEIGEEEDEEETVPPEDDYEDPEAPEGDMPEKGEDDNECPEGLNFGHDCETQDVCDDCDNDIWEKCKDKQEELRASTGDDVPF